MSILPARKAAFTNAEYCAANGYQDMAGGAPVWVPALNLQPGVEFWIEKF